MKESSKILFKSDNDEFNLKLHKKVNSLISASYMLRSKYLLWFKHIQSPRSCVIPTPKSQKHLPCNPDCYFGVPNHKSWAPRGIHTQSIKVQVWTPRCPMGCS